MENEIKMYFKGDVIKLLEREKWYPSAHLTEVEYKTAEMLNECLDKIIGEVILL